MNSDLLFGYLCFGVISAILHVSYRDFHDPPVKLWEYILLIAIWPLCLGYSVKLIWRELR